MLPDASKDYVLRDYVEDASEEKYLEDAVEVEVVEKETEVVVGEEVVLRVLPASGGARGELLGYAVQVFKAILLVFFEAIYMEVVLWLMK